MALAIEFNMYMKFRIIRLLCKEEEIIAKRCVYDVGKDKSAKKGIKGKWIDNIFLDSSKMLGRDFYERNIRTWGLILEDGKKAIRVFQSF